MKFGFVISHHVGTIAILLSLGSVHVVCAADGGQPIEFSAVNGGASTNARIMISPAANSINLKDQMWKPDALDFRNKRPVQIGPPPVMSPPRREEGPASPDEALNRFLAKQLLKISEVDPDDKDRSTVLLERYYDRLSRGRGGETNATARYGFVGANNSGEQSAAGPADAAPGSLKALLRSDSDDSMFSSSLRPKSVSDLLGLPRNQDSFGEAERTRKTQQNQVEAFRKILNLQPSVVDTKAAPNLVNPSFVPAGPMPGITPNDPFRAAIAGPGAPGFAAAGFPSAPSAPLAPGQSIAPSRPRTLRMPPPDPVFSMPQRRF